MGRLVYTDNYYAIKRGLPAGRGTSYYPCLNASSGTVFTDVSGNEHEYIGFISSQSSSTYIYVGTGYFASITDFRRLPYDGTYPDTTFLQIGLKPSSWANIFDVPNQISTVAYTISGNQSMQNPTIVYTPIVITITNTSTSPITFNCIGYSPSIATYSQTTGTNYLYIHYLLWVYEWDTDITLEPSGVYTLSITKPTTEFTGG